MTAEGVNAARSAAKQLTKQEAEMILGVEPGATWQEISKVGMGSACCANAGTAWLAPATSARPFGEPLAGEGLLQEAAQPHGTSHELPFGR